MKTFIQKHFLFKFKIFKITNMSLENIILESVSLRHTFNLYFKTLRHFLYDKKHRRFRNISQSSVFVEFLFLFGLQVEKNPSLIARLIQYPYPPYNKYITFKNISQEFSFLFGLRSDTISLPNEKVMEPRWKIFFIK